MKNRKSQIQSQTIFSLFLYSIFLLCFFTTSFAQEGLDNKEVTFVNSIPERLSNKSKTELPIKVEIFNAEKGFILDNLQIKVTNIGERNIYQLRMSLHVSDKLSSIGRTTISLRYGRKELDSGIAELVNEKDIPIKPNESIILKVKESTAKMYKNNFKRRYNDVPRQFELTFGDLSFGDGTGIYFKGRYEKKNGKIN